MIGLYNSDGTIAVEYEYDAWGNATIYKIVNGEYVDITETEINHIGNLNAIRYRGYYYDVDMGLYYLQSRYYDASIGRFINANKGISDIGGEIPGYNMFAYGFNNPINSCDSRGTSPKWLKEIVARFEYLGKFYGGFLDLYLVLFLRASVWE